MRATEKSGKQNLLEIQSRRLIEINSQCYNFHMFSPKSKDLNRAFTVVELLVVIAVIGILSSLLLPAVQKARTTAARTDEMSSARQLMIAWESYAVQYKESVLPGYKVGLRAWNESGFEIAEVSNEIAAARYPWRLAPFLNYDFRSLYRGINTKSLAEMQQMNDGSYAYAVSVYPSLGLNTTWVGGDQNELGFSPTALSNFGKFYVQKLGDIRKTGDLLVFASARGSDPTDPSASPLEGFFRVRSPRFAFGQDERWAESIDANTSSSETGHVHFRYGGAAVIACADGHVESQGPDALRDMRRWANRADSEDYGLSPQ